MAVIDLNNLVRPKQQYKTSVQVDEIVNNPTPVYTDLHLDLKAALNIGIGDNPTNTSDILVDNDVEAIKNSLRNIFTTKKGQKILNPDFGVSLEQYLFSPLTNANAKAIGTDIMNGVSKYEPRIKINNIIVNPLYDENQYYIAIYYSLLQLNAQNIINIIAQLGGQVLI